MSLWSLYVIVYMCDCHVSALFVVKSCFVNAASDISYPPAANLSYPPGIIAPRSEKKNRKKWLRKRKETEIKWLRKRKELQEWLIVIYDNVSSRIHRAYFLGLLNVARCCVFADQSISYWMSVPQFSHPVLWSVTSTASEPHQTEDNLARHWRRRDSSSHMCSTSARRV
jgi:hypothetical protein